jgi:hypothetical protein
MILRGFMSHILELGRRYLGEIPPGLLARPKSFKRYTVVDQQADAAIQRVLAQRILQAHVRERVAAAQPTHSFDCHRLAGLRRTTIASADRPLGAPRCRTSAARFLREKSLAGQWNGLLRYDSWELKRWNTSS